MKKAVLLFTAVGMLFSGCNNFLNEEPDARAKVETYQDIKELLVNAYPQATYHLINETMSDNVTDMGVGSGSATAITDEEMYYWKEGTDDDTDSPFAVWTGWYAGIASANHALREIEKLPETPELKALKGEALLCRALGHFLLVNLWAEHYDPATAAMALGVPYVKEPETVAVKYYERNTVQECYDYIEEDMLRGISMIKDEIYDQPKFHFSKRSAHAFAARFYTYKGTDWGKVLKHANLAIPENFETEMRNNVEMNRLAVMEYMRQYTLPTQAAILLSVTVETYWNDMYATCPPRNSTYSLSPVDLRELIPIIGSNSFTGSVWNYRREGNTGLDVAATMAKFYAYFKNESLTSNRGMTYLNVPMFTVEDVALNKIEAYAMMGDTLHALQNMDRYISKRANKPESVAKMSIPLLKKYYEEPKGMVAAPDLEPHYAAELQADPNKMYIMKAVSQLRRMEFMQEGMRWFDIKRFHLPVTHRINSTAKNMVLERYDKRRALQIPQEAQKRGVVPNER